MDIRITITVPAAIRGRVNPGPTTLTLTEADMDPLGDTGREALAAMIDERGELRDHAYRLTGPNGDINVRRADIIDVPSLLVEARRVADLVATEREAKRARREAEDAAYAWIAAHRDHVIAIARTYTIATPHGVVCVDIPTARQREGIPEIYEAILAGCNHRAAEGRQRAGMEDYHRRAAEAAKEAAKEAYLDAWVARGRSRGELAEQWNDGLLCRNELLALIAAEALDPIGPEWEMAVCADRRHACGQREVTCVPRRLYSDYVRFRTRLRAACGAITQLYRETACLRRPLPDEPYAGLDDDEVGDELGITTYTADVAVKVGPFTFTRRVEVR